MSDSVWSHRRQPTRLPLPCDSPGKNTGVGCHFLLQCVKVKREVNSLSRVRLLAAPWTIAYQAPPSMGFFQARVLEWGAIQRHRKAKWQLRGLPCSPRTHWAGHYEWIIFLLVTEFWALIILVPLQDKSKH